jgi:pimeloyl-ACP methyl ester carboxylesterase
MAFMLSVLQVYGVALLLYLCVAAAPTHIARRIILCALVAAHALSSHLLPTASPLAALCADAVAVALLAADSALRWPALVGVASASAVSIYLDILQPTARTYLTVGLALVSLEWCASVATGHVVGHAMRNFAAALDAMLLSPAELDAEDVSVSVGKFGTVRARRTRGSAGGRSAGGSGGGEESSKESKEDGGLPAVPAEPVDVLIIPDGPADVSHYEELVGRVLRDEAVGAAVGSVVVADLPGFGKSQPSPAFSHSFGDVAEVVRELLDWMGGRRVVVCATCVNGLFALFAASRDARICGLVLSQTPSVAAMRAWALRTIPAPVMVPVLGQLVVHAGREKVAKRWIRGALPQPAAAAADSSPSDRSPLEALMTAKAVDTLRHGGCFCLATLV